jgi:hypothetical protein
MSSSGHCVDVMLVPKSHSPASRGLSDVAVARRMWLIFDILELKTQLSHIQT